MNTRERRERKAERLVGWAEKRRSDVSRSRAADEPMRSDWAFITQPGHIPERERMNRRDARNFESLRKADAMQQRAAGINAQLNRSIYSDDDDATERLEERIAGLEEEREGFKAYNALCRKRKGELTPEDWESLPVHVKKTATGLARVGMLRANKSLPPFVLSNLGAEIRRNQKRLDELRKGPKVRFIYARHDGECPDCDEPIEKGQPIANPGGVWMHGTCARTNHDVA